MERFMNVKHISPFPFFSVIIFFLMACCPPSFAQPPQKGWSPWAVSQQTDYVFERKVHAQEGRFLIGRAGLSLKREYRFENGLPLEFFLGWDHFAIYDRTPVDLPASLQSKGLSIGTKIPMPFVEDKRFFLGLDAGSYFQTAKDHGFDRDAFRMKSRIYGIYREQEKARLILAAGVMVYSGYEDQTVLPFIGFKYDLNDRWSVNFLSNEPFIAYRMNDRTRWKWQLGGYRDEFEVVSGSRKGDVVKINEFHAAMGFEHDFLNGMRFEILGGWAFNRKYEYHKTAGKVVPEDGAFIGYAFKASF